jgi:hypothetical protein
LAHALRGEKPIPIPEPDKTMNIASRITPADMLSLAFLLVDRHGAKALGYADLAVGEMEEAGDDQRAEAWRALKSVVEDALAGRIERDSEVTLH